MMMKADWMKEEVISLAELCDLLNRELSINPKMRLADFAERLNNGIKAETLRRVEKAEEEQFNAGGGVYYED